MVETVHPARAAEPRRLLSPAAVAAVLVSALLLLALGWWTHRSVERSLRELRAASLASLLEAEVRALAIWVQNRESDVRRLARDSQVRASVEALVRIAARPGGHADDYCNAPARRPLVEQLGAVLEEQGAVAFNTLDRSRRIVASRFRQYCGLSVSAAAFERELAPVFEGETRFVRPYHEAERLETPPSPPPLDRPLTWIAAPVRNGAGEIIAALGFGEYADGQFAAILSAARTGETGEAYAFDRGGELLSVGRFADGPARSPLGRGKEERGTTLDPYPSYHGGRVIGAWRWLPEYDMGIAVEMSADEAYAPLRYLNIALGAVFGALALAVFAALVSAFFAARLRQELGRKVGPYRLLERIGEGGMANVYRARHDLLKRPAAVKILKLSRSSDELVARFQREARHAASLAHPNSVEVFDYGSTRDGEFYFAMEYLDGLTLGEILAKEGTLPVPRTLHLLHQVCAALAEAHGKGLVHRDIKPDNIMVCRYGGIFDHVKILDFGLVKQLSGKHSRDLTRNLRILGTPLYMAPERLRNPGDVDARADIYSVGAVAYLMLSGRNVFASDNDLSLTTAILNDAPQPLDEVAPPALRELVLRCLAKRREDRPQTISELAEALEALALEHRWTQRDAEAWWAPVPRRTIIGQ